MIDQQPTQRMKRGLTLMCKIMQNIANHVLFTKEQHMRHFNEFLKGNFDSGRRSDLFNVLPNRKRTISNELGDETAGGRTELGSRWCRI